MHACIYIYMPSGSCRYFSFPRLQLPYSTDITPTSKITPTPTWGKVLLYMYRLVCLENTPTRKWCINFVSESCQESLTVSCIHVKWLALNVARYIARSSNYSYLQVYETRTIFSNLCWRQWQWPSDAESSLVYFSLYLHVATLPMHNYYCCILMFSIAGRPQTQTEKYIVSSWVGLFSRQNYYFRIYSPVAAL